MNKDILRKFAKLAVHVGVNVQPKQELFINASIEANEFVCMVAEEAYKKGAKKVNVNWISDKLNRINMENIDEKDFEVPDYIVKRFEYIKENKACILSIISPTPDLLEGINPKKIKANAIANNKALSFFREFTMGNNTQWSIVGYPSLSWARKVFPNDNDDVALNKLFKAIIDTSRVLDDPIKNWEEHNKTLSVNNKKLNDFNFDKLIFKNSLGTNIEIGLADDHVWAGGCEYSTENILFNPNIPTEESFTMPHKDRVNGIIYSTKPLSYQGNLIDEFYLEFKDGEVINYGAKKGLDTLKELLTMDKNSNRLGEVALISYDSPISKSNILFYNTLFDENASCHVALGRAYPMNIKNGTKTDIKDLVKKGYNDSIIHVDFMFGSEDLDVIGIKKDGTKVQVFKNGNFVI